MSISSRVSKTTIGAITVFYLAQVWFAPEFVQFDSGTRINRLVHWVSRCGLRMNYINENSVINSPLATSPVPIVDIPIIDGTWDEVKDAIAAKKGTDLPLIVIRNFSRGTELEGFGTVEGFIERTNNTQHSFSHVHLGDNASAGNTSSVIGLHDAVRRMQGGEQLYGGFMFDLLKKNHQLESAVYTTLQQLEEVPALKFYFDEFIQESTVHHSFVYHGTWHWALLHNAPIPDAFLQIANRKKWYFTVPDYIPHMRPVCLGGAGCRFMMDPRDQDRIPFREVIVGPGDLLVFPGFWPHAVANMDEEFGLGVGVRPLKIAHTLTKLFTPFRVSRGSYWPTMNWFLRLVVVITNGQNTFKVAKVSKTNLSYNLPHLEAIALSLSRKYELSHPQRVGGHTKPYAGPPENKVAAISEPHVEF